MDVNVTPEGDALFEVSSSQRASLVGSYDLQAVVYGSGTVCWVLTETTWPGGTKSRRMIGRGIERVPSIDTREVSISEMLDMVVGSYEAM